MYSVEERREIGDMFETFKNITRMNKVQKGSIFIFGTNVDLY